MEFRRKSSFLYAHFVFYPNPNSEDKAVKQCLYVREKLCEMFAARNVDYLMGAHLFSCYRQCGYNFDEVRCICDVSPQIQNDRFLGRCYILPEPRDASTIDNHIHILVHVPAANSTGQQCKVGYDVSVQSVAGKNPSAKRIKVEEAAQVSVSGNSGNLTVNERSADMPSATISPSTLPVDTFRDSLDPVITTETNMNWQLEGVVRQIQKFFSIDLKNKEFGSFSVQQRNVWCPYSLWTSFVVAAGDGFTTIVGNTFNYAMKMERKRQSADYANRELFPKRAPKMKARVLWELHCISMQQSL